MAMTAIAIQYVLATPMLFHFLVSSVPLYPVAGTYIPLDELFNKRWAILDEKENLQPQNAIHNASRLTKRADIDAVAWQEYVCKGGKLLDLLSAPQDSTNPDLTTQWTQFSQLSDYGWDSSAPDFSFLRGLQPVLEALQLSTGPSSWTDVSAVHGHTYELQGKTWQGTQAHYDMIFNVAEGGIIATESYSPDYLVKTRWVPQVIREALEDADIHSDGSIVDENGNKIGEIVSGDVQQCVDEGAFDYDNPGTIIDQDEKVIGTVKLDVRGANTADWLPALMLKQWSDISFLEWEKTASSQNADASKIKYFIRSTVVNTETQSVVGYALTSKYSSSYDQLGDYPGQEFGMDTDEGKAILAAPNGNGQAWFLAQHKSALGVKTVQSVRVWRTGTALDLYMLFIVGGV